MRSRRASISPSSETGELAFLAAEDDPLSPAQRATWPDEATEFYVSLLPGQRRSASSPTATSAASRARSARLSRASSRCCASSSSSCTTRRIIDTAEGSELDRVVALLAIARKRRGYASGKVRFFRDTPASADIFIPDGTRVSTALRPAGVVRHDRGRRCCGAGSSRSRPNPRRSAGRRGRRRREDHHASSIAASSASAASRMPRRRCSAARARPMRSCARGRRKSSSTRGAPRRMP